MAQKEYLSPKEAKLAEDIRFRVEVAQHVARQIQKQRLNKPESFIKVNGIECF